MAEVTTAVDEATEAEEAAAAEAMAAALAAGWRKSGTWGGTGGTFFSDDLTGLSGLLGFVIRSAVQVDSIQAIYSSDQDGSTSRAQHGGNGGTQGAFAFRDGERVIKIKGHAGSLVDGIQIITNRWTYDWFGGSGGTEWEFEAEEIGGIFGRSGSKLDQIGFFYK